MATRGGCTVTELGAYTDPKPDTKVGRLRTELFNLLDKHRRDGMLPTSARFLFYELVQRRVISKQKTGARRADQDMSDALTDLRERGHIPWHWIVDETRSLDSFVGSRSISDWCLGVLDQARIDPWKGDAPLVITESRSLAGVLREMCRDYAVRITATNGQCGGFLRTDVAPILSGWDRVLYFGDFDLAGNDIENNTREVLERAAAGLHWERLALTREQVDHYGLPVITKHDARFKNGGAHDAVETEALRQSIIVDILRTRLDELLPEPLTDVLVREGEQREGVRRLLNGGAL